MKRKLIAIMLCAMLVASFILPIEASASEASTNEIKWVLENYYDEFGRMTEEQIVCNEELIYGQFSNSVTQNSKLGVFLIADKSDVYLILYEYGNMMLSNNLTTRMEEYDVSILDAKDKKTTLRGAIGPGDFRLYFEDNDAIIEALESGSISFAITKANSQVTRYNFTINDTKDFIALYNQIVSE